MNNNRPRTRTAVVQWRQPIGIALVIFLLGPAASTISTRSAQSSDSGRRSETTDSQINPDGYTSSRVCGSCHVDIYKSWKNSLHAFSLSDPIFDAAYMQAIKEAGEPAKRLCLRCHAPMTLFNSDFDFKEGVTTEGVSCDFCHTITAVHLDNSEQPYSAELGLVKRSVLKNADSPEHEVAYSELHGTAEFCGGCHNYKAASGALIMGTYDEWRRGPYAAEGIQCQDCHMGLSKGNVVSEDVKQSGSEIHLHDLIHDTEQLRGALSVEIMRAERTAHGLRVDVAVRNVGSGHMVPTGIPSRQVLLKVTAEVSGRVFNSERRYRKVVADEKGRVLNLDHEVLLYGAMILNDNRIGPREERLETFTLPVPDKGRVNVSATMTYVYTPLVLEQRRMNIRMGSAEQTVD